MLVVWGEDKILVCVPLENNSNQIFLMVLCNKNGLIVGEYRCMFCIQLRHDHFGWEVWDYILPWCLHGLPTKGSKNIHGHFCCWRRQWDKSLINQCKWNDSLLCKWRCLEGDWLCWYQKFLCRFFLDDLLYFRKQLIVQGKNLIFVIEHLRRCEDRLVSCSLVIVLAELKNVLVPLVLYFFAFMLVFQIIFSSYWYNLCHLILSLIVYIQAFLW